MPPKQTFPIEKHVDNLHRHYLHTPNREKAEDINFLAIGQWSKICSVDSPLELHIQQKCLYHSLGQGDSSWHEFKH